MSLTVSHISLKLFIFLHSFSPFELHNLSQSIFKLAYSLLRWFKSTDEPLWWTFHFGYCAFQLQSFYFPFHNFSFYIDTLYLMAHCFHLYFFNSSSSLVPWMCCNGCFEVFVGRSWRRTSVTGSWHCWLCVPVSVSHFPVSLPVSWSLKNGTFWIVCCSNSGSWSTSPSGGDCCCCLLVAQQLVGLS